jgi:hypothetical protein
MCFSEELAKRLQDEEDRQAAEAVAHAEDAAQQGQSESAAPSGRGQHRGEFVNAAQHPSTSRQVAAAAGAAGGGHGRHGERDRSGNKSVSLGPKFTNNGFLVGFFTPSGTQLVCTDLTIV